MRAILLICFVLWATTACNREEDQFEDEVADRIADMCREGTIRCDD